MNVDKYEFTKNIKEDINYNSIFMRCLMLKQKVSNVLAEQDEVDPNEDGSCPDGYELSDDKKKCVKMKDEEECKEFVIGNNDPQFVATNKLVATLENNKKCLKIEISEGEELELIENGDNLQIGSSKNVLLVKESSLVLNLLNCVAHKDDIEIQTKSMSVSEAIKSNVPVSQIAKKLIEIAVKGKTVVSKLTEKDIQIGVERKIKTNRTVEHKLGKIKKLSETRIGDCVVYNVTGLTVVK